MAQSKKTMKTIALSLLAVMVIAALTLGILVYASNNNDADNTGANTPQSFIEAGNKSARSAAKHEESGNTQAALDDYKKALFAYQQAGDKQGEESVKLQIAYLESLLKK